MAASKRLCGVVVPAFERIAACITLLLVAACDDGGASGVDAGARDGDVVVDAARDATAGDASSPIDAGEGDGGALDGEAGTADASGPSDAAAEAGIDPAPPTIAHVALRGGSPCRPFTCEASGIIDANGDAVEVAYAWHVDGAPIVHADATLAPGLVTLGQAVRCAARATDGTIEAGALVYGPEVSSEPVVAADEPPMGRAVIGGHVRAGRMLTCAVEASDDCEVAPDVTYTWTVDGVAVDATPTFDTTGVAVGSTIACSASIDDGVHTPVVAASGVETILASTWSIEPRIPRGRAGYALAVLDDLDGDGLSEIAIGAPDTSTTAARQAGAVYVVYGRDHEVVTAIEGQGVQPWGAAIVGTSGSYDLRAMGCTPYIVSACPQVRNVGALDGEDTGPEGAGFGAGLAWLEDLDGDGAGELVASAPYELVSNLWRGRTYVLASGRLMDEPVVGATLEAEGFTVDGECGRRRDLDQSMRHLASPSDATNGDLGGYRVVPVGDANGDGLGDFAISAPNHGDDDEGSIFVVYGRTDGAALDVGGIYTRGCSGPEVSSRGPRAGVDGIAAFGPNETNSASVSANWGVRLAPLGDFDGDGYDDVLVPTGGFGATNVANIVRGGSAQRGVSLAHPSADPSALWGLVLGDFRYVNGVSTGRWEGGFPSGGGGDVNADGFDDIVVVGRDFDHDTFVRVIFGRASAPGGVLDTDEASDGSGRGFAVRGSIGVSSTSGRAGVIGDVDGDGYDDFAASAIIGDDGQGRVYIVHGGPSVVPGVSATSLASGVGGFIIAGTQNGEELGTEMIGGDVDGDGLDDVILGAPGWDRDGENEVGRVRVVFGTPRVGALVGGKADDVLRATESARSIIGGRGNDVLVGRGGADALYGGAGADRLEVSDTTFRRVRGGRGEDTLVLASGSGDLDLRVARARVEGIERIVLRGQALTVSAVTSLRVSDHRRLVVQGTGAVFTTPGDGWMGGADVTLEGTAYRVLRAGRAELLLEPTLETAIPPTVLATPWVVAENPATGAEVGRITALDPDGATASLVFAIDVDPSGALAIDPATGALRVTSSAWFDFEARRGIWTITVRVTDEDGLATTAAIPVSVGDVNEAPRFPPGALAWNVEEGSTGVFGDSGAWDVDYGDVITYSLLVNPGDVFAIDPVTGSIGVAPLGTLDYETAATLTFTIGATDASGLMSAREATVHVGDIDVVERDLRLTFTTRDWSTRDDDLASNSEGLEVLGLTTQGQTEYCYTVPASDALHTENFSSQWTNGWPSAPMSFEAEYSGTFCANTAVRYDEGSWSATIPMDVHLEIPDEVAPGATFTLVSSATPVESGAALWGTSPGLELSFGVRLANVNVYLAGCDSVFTHTCSVAVNRRGINTSYARWWGTESFAWSGGRLDDDSRFVLTVAAPIMIDGHDIVIDWDAYWMSVARTMGLPSNEGTFQYSIGGSGSGMTATMEYELFNTDVVFRSAAASVVSLEVYGVDATLWFEDGSSLPFRIGERTTVRVPAGGDVDGDGDVDVSVTFELDSAFTNEFEHAERAGYALSGGRARTRVVSVAGDVLANRRVGPAFEQLCAPRVGGAEIPITCFTSGESTTYGYRPTGFNVPRIEGAIDLAP